MALCSWGCLLAPPLRTKGLLLRKKMAHLRLYLFGTPRVAHNDEFIELNLRKGLALLAYIAVTRQPQSRDTLATLLWPEKDQQTARANLRRTIYELGQLLGAQLFVTTAETIALP